MVEFVVTISNKYQLLLSEITLGLKLRNASDAKFLFMPKEAI